MIGNNELNTKLKKQSRNYIIGITILSLIVFIFIVIGIYVGNRELSDPISFSEIVTDSSRTNTYATTSVSLVTDNFATYEEDGVIQKYYYFVFDGSNYLIAAIDEDTFKKLDKIYEYTYSEDEDLAIPEPVSITGTSSYIGSDLKEIAVESFNELMGEEVVTSETFSDLFGVLYLDTAIDPHDDAIFFYMLALLFLIFDVILVCSYVVIVRKRKNVFKKYSQSELDSIFKEVDEKSTVKFEKIKLYLLNEKLVDISEGLEVVSYDDIVWVYPSDVKSRGILIGKQVNLWDKNMKMHKVGVANRFQVNEFDTVYSEVVKKIPNAFFGYTSENIDKFNTIKKEYKEEKKRLKQENKKK